MSRHKKRSMIPHAQSLAPKLDHAYQILESTFFTAATPIPNGPIPTSFIYFCIFVALESARGVIDAESTLSGFSDPSKIEAAACYHLKSECETNGLLARPKDITSDDPCDNVNDNVTVL